MVNFKTDLTKAGWTTKKPEEVLLTRPALATALEFLFRIVENNTSFMTDNDLKDWVAALRNGPDERVDQGFKIRVGCGSFNVTLKVSTSFPGLDPALHSRILTTFLDVEGPDADSMPTEPAVWLRVYNALTVLEPINRTLERAFKGMVMDMKADMPRNWDEAHPRQDDPPDAEDLSVRCVNALERLGVKRFTDCTRWTLTTWAKEMGPRAVKELEAALAKRNMKFRDPDTVSCDSGKCRGKATEPWHNKVGDRGYYCATHALTCKAG